MRSTMHSRIVVPIAIVVALASVPALAGCFGNPVQSLVKSATGGNVDVGGSSLPGDFPKEVPTAKGKIDTSIAVGKGDKKTWNVSIEVPGQSAAKDIASQLKGAGFSIEEQSESGSDGSTIIASTKTWGVLVVVVKHDKGWVANYTVTSAKNTDSSN